MDKDSNIYLINKNIPKQLLKFLNNFEYTHYINFSNSNHIETILTDNQNSLLTIYDQTITPDPVGTIYPVNDHINRIGDNPFIGNQKRLNIDFINTENIYTQHSQGIITDSCGTHRAYGPYPSSYVANIATMAHIFKYKIKAFLINTSTL
tara:strand:- start:501 stop:950 length:450 start_codon:yes stop_codon:yes gene_type:complete